MRVDVGCGKIIISSFEKLETKNHPLVNETRLWGNIKKYFGGGFSKRGVRSRQIAHICEWIENNRLEFDTEFSLTFCFSTRFIIRS